MSTTDKNKKFKYVIDVDRLFLGATQYVDPEGDDESRYETLNILDTYIDELTQYAFREGQLDAIRQDGVRMAFIEGETYWRDQHDRADGPVGRAIANAVAEAFREWGYNYHKSKRRAADQLNDETTNSFLNAIDQNGE